MLRINSEAPIVKDYLSYENTRNKTHAALYERLMRAAFGECAVIVGHHLTFEKNGDLTTENEIPSADTLIFDHEVMKAVFGGQAKSIMMHLASVPAEERDLLLERWLNTYGTKQADVRPFGPQGFDDPRHGGTSNATEIARLNFMKCSMDHFELTDGRP